MAMNQLWYLYMHMHMCGHGIHHVQPVVPQWDRVMRTIETHGTVSPDGSLSVRVPPDIPAGEHRVVVVIDERPLVSSAQPLPPFPILDLGPWLDNLSLRREDMYGPDGR